MAKDRDYAAFQVASGQQSALMLKLLRLRDELGVTPEEFHVLFTDDGDPHLERMMAGLRVSTAESKTYLRQLYAGETIIIGPTDGTQTIAQAKDVFTGLIDRDFARLRGLGNTHQATGPTRVRIFEMSGDNGSFSKIYGSFGQPYDQLCFDSQHQVVVFCVEHKDRLHRNGCTFFLFKCDNEWFVASVRVQSNGSLCVRLSHRSYKYSWDAASRHRFVIPLPDQPV